MAFARLLAFLAFVAAVHPGCGEESRYDLTFEEAVAVLDPWVVSPMAKRRAALRIVVEQVGRRPEVPDALVLAMGLDPGVVPWEPAIRSIADHPQELIPRLERGVVSRDYWENRFCIMALGRIGPAAARSIPVLEARLEMASERGRINPVGLRRLVESAIRAIRP